MPIDRKHLEFHAVDLDRGWQVLPVAAGHLEQKILSGTLDEANRRGARTRLLRFHPGTYTTEPIVHDYWEEVYVVAGELFVGNDARGEGGTPFQVNTYACRPPGAYHGPFKSEKGCLLLETHYYDPA